MRTTKERSACSSVLKVFHERVSFFYLSQNLHNPYILSPSLCSDRSQRLNFIGDRFHKTPSKTIVGAIPTLLNSF
ncbi:hypothetical protein H6G27_22520 [Nostoc linckia FACHB-104]|nr:hypothetical protein [Nostoc linckia FACHB-104]